MTRARTSLIGLLATILAMAGITYVALDAEAHDYAATGVGDCYGNVVWTYHQKNTPAGMQTDVKAISYDDGTGPTWINAWVEHNQGGTIPSKTGNYTTTFTQTSVTKPVAGVFIQVDYKNGPNSSDTWYYATMPTDCEPPTETEEPSPSITPTPTDTPSVTPTPSTGPTPTGPPTTAPPIVEPSAPVPSDTPTITTPPAPTPTITSPPQPPFTMPPVKPGKPDVGTPTTGYMVCEDGTWVTYVDGEKASTSGTCGGDGQRIPVEDVREEGF